MRIAAFIVLLATAIVSPAAASNNGEATANADGTAPSNIGAAEHSSFLLAMERDLGSGRELGSYSGSKDYDCFCERRRGNGDFDDDEPDDDKFENCEDIPRRGKCIARKVCRWQSGRCRDARRVLEGVEEEEENEEPVEIEEEGLDEEDRDLRARGFINVGGVGGINSGRSSFSRDSDDHRPGNNVCERIEWESRCVRAGCRWIDRLDECRAYRDNDGSCSDYDKKKYCLRKDGCAWTCIGPYTQDALVESSFVVKQLNSASGHAVAGGKVSLGLASAATLFVLWF